MIWDEKRLEPNMKNENLIANGECDITGNTLKTSDVKDVNGIIERKNWHPNQKYDINWKFFVDKNTEEFAYFLGFFYADGYNNIKQGKIVITLKISDLNLLNTFSKAFFGNRPVSIYDVSCQTNDINKVCSLLIGSRKLSNFLASCGAYQNKTFKIRFPYWLPQNLIRHFIRGYFDGDGSIMKHGRQYRLSIASNRAFNSGLKTIIEKETGLCFDLRSHGKITVLYKGGNRMAKRFCDWLYKDASIYLHRKYRRYLELLDETKRVDKKYSHVYFNKSDNKWIARLPNKLQRKCLGSFSTQEAALKSYQDYFSKNQK